MYISKEEPLYFGPPVSPILAINVSEDDGARPRVLSRRCNIAESLASGMHFKRARCQLGGKKNA